MADNYKDTVYRMHESSETLYKNGQWFNSNYLAGYVLECYCKLVLSYTLCCGGSLSRTTVRGYGHNINSMRTDIDMILLNGGTALPYCIDILIECNKLILNWDTIIRYESATHALNACTLADDINKEINKLMDIVLKMDVDGVI